MDQQQAVTESKRTTRRCVTCFQTKPLTAEFFYRAAERSAGFQNTCKACRQTSSRKHGQHPGSNSAFGLPPLLYERNCNKCDARYRGPGRLLCPNCFKSASGAMSLAAEMTDGHYRASRGPRS